MRKFSVFFISALLAGAFSPQVFAHAHLKSQYPAANARVTASPQALTLTFSEDIEPAFSGVDLTDAGQKSVPLAKAQRAPQQHNQMIVPLEKPLVSGLYQVNWHVLSTDGHKTSGTYSFSVK
ncbi:CopC domain-containing protein YobA [Erwinia psidii]|uniref:Copper resistance protein C n=1 Tax=Erwinia psidii TaxID=69224 RepID=A0A3N6UT61_9GAMM|nr:CopC domain-containing protein YobA [Erwinia psidii]MCX8956206.1 CopC domain-containing protein YobA [Erwinia psidii]MCX8960034.1 CopC domain-containing protein YobA [Erwinia psidii]MCX8963579.1 CopC domain-containing protein YobA [Erwinia psidii]RQM39209.1 CopC domain-containing protein YobA [Erwinia psidii]